MGQLSHAELTWAKKVLGWLCAELNLWRVKVSVPLTIRVRIRTLSFPLSHSHSSSPTLPSPSLPPFKSQEPPSARTTTVVARPPPLVREQMLSPSSYSPQLTVAIARPSQVSLSFSPFPVLLTNSCSSLTQALWATPAPPHAQALLHRSGTFFFFFFLDSRWLKVHRPRHHRCLDRPTNHDAVSAAPCRSTTLSPCATGKAGRRTGG